MLVIDKEQPNDLLVNSAGMPTALFEMGTLG